MKFPLFFRQAEIVVVELEPPAFLAPVQVQGRDLLAEVGELAHQEMPAPRRPADPDGQLAERAEAELADGTGRLMTILHGDTPEPHGTSPALYPKRPRAIRDGRSTEEQARNQVSIS